MQKKVEKFLFFQRFPEKINLPVECKRCVCFYRREIEFPSGIKLKVPACKRFSKDYSNITEQEFLKCASEQYTQLQLFDEDEIL